MKKKLIIENLLFYIDALLIMIIFFFIGTGWLGEYIYLLLTIILIFLLCLFKKTEKIKKENKIILTLIILLLMVIYCLFPKKIKITKYNPYNTKQCKCIGIQSCFQQVNACDEICFGWIYGCEK